MQRVMIVGAPGSGKSTLARMLGDRTGLPVYHMDHLHHLPDWQPRPFDEKIAMGHAIEAREKWIFEGGMSATYDNRAARADTLIWLDLPVALRMRRVLRRIWQYYGTTRPDMAEGCRETLGWHTVEFVQWIIQTRKGGRRKIMKLINTYGSELTVYHLSRPWEVDAFITKFDQGDSGD